MELIYSRKSPPVTVTAKGNKGLEPAQIVYRKPCRGLHGPERRRGQEGFSEGLLLG